MIFLPPGRKNGAKLAAPFDVTAWSFDPSAFMIRISRDFGA